MKLSLIAAIAQNGCIGINNKLPWYLPEDLKYFRRLTTGNIVIMGRKTYESIGKPLPNRSNIVISRNSDFHAEGVKIVTSIDDALKVAQSIAEISDTQEAFIMGGAQIYEQSLPLAQRLYITEVKKTVTGDAFFPSIDLAQWQEIGREAHYYEPQDTHYDFVVYERRSTLRQRLKLFAPN
jgi:dihydrofolate reductase